MATAKSIGSLFIDIEARTAKMETDMAKVKSILQDTQKDVGGIASAFTNSNSIIETKLARFGVLLFGARSVVQLLAKDVRDVIKNVEDIPGIPPDLLSSIQNLRHDLVGASIDTKLAIAEIVGFAYTSAKLIGGLGAALVETLAGRGAEAAAALGEIVNGNPNLSPDQLARDRNPNYDKDVAAAKEVLRERTEASARAAMDEAHQIIALREAQGTYFDIMEDGTKTGLEQTQAATKQQSLYSEELSKTESMQKKLVSVNELYANAAAKSSIATDSLRQRIKAYQEGIAQTQLDLADNSVNAQYGDDNAKTIALANEIKLKEKLVTLTTSLAAAQRKYGEEGMLAGKIVADDLGEAILKGENLHDLFQSLIGDLLKMILQREILGPLGDFLGGGFSALFNLGGHAMGGPVNGPTWVGENGPEIFNPGGPGTIIPSGKLGGGGGGNQYFIDATGADPAAIARLQQSLLTLAGPGVVERRSVAATLNAAWRGGGTGRAIRA